MKYRTTDVYRILRGEYSEYEERIDYDVALEKSSPEAKVFWKGFEETEDIVVSMLSAGITGDPTRYMTGAIRGLVAYMNGERHTSG